MLPKSTLFYNENLLSKYGEPIGSLLNEVEQLEREMDVILPESLKQYLLWSGKHHNVPLIGTDCFISDIQENTEYLPEFFVENSLEHVSDEKFIVFYSHQGYVLAWVYLTGEDNPVVHYFAEGSTSKINTVSSIDDWFYDDLSGLN